METQVTVPPNASAIVALPGRPEVEVGSGTHRWSTSAPELSGKAHGGRLSMDTPLSELVWDPELAGAIRRCFAQTGYFIGFGWDDGGKWRPDTTLRTGLPMATPEQVQALGEVLDAANERRGHPLQDSEHWSLASGRVVL